MENNNLKQWFDAAKNAEPIVSVQEVGAMINTPSRRMRVKPTFKTYFIMGTSLIVMGGLTWLLTLNPEKTDIKTSIPVTELQPPVEQERVIEVPQPRQPQRKLHKNSNRQAVWPAPSDTGKKAAVIPIAQPSGGYNTSPQMFAFDVAIPPMEGDGMLRLTSKELAKLGIETDGHKLRYLTQTDTTKLHYEFNGPVTRVFAFDFDISVAGDIRISNTVKEDAELHNRSVKVMPFIVSVDKTNGEDPEYWLKRIDVPLEYRYTYIESVKDNLVPVMVETKPVLGPSSKSKTMILWYANTEEFRNLLPSELALQVKQQYPDFDEEAHRTLINSLIEFRKENDAKYTLSKARRDELWDERLLLTPKELKELGINFNGRKLEFKLVNQVAGGEYSSTRVEISPNRYSINTRGKLLKTKPTELFPWYTTDTNMVAPLHNFIDHSEHGSKSYEFQIRDRKKLFMNRLDSMVPVYIEFDKEAVSKATTKDPSTCELLWFPVSPEFIKALPERYKQQVALKTAHIDIKKVNIIELPDSVYPAIGLSTAPGTIAIPFSMSGESQIEYSHGGSTTTMPSLSREEYYALPEWERGDSLQIVLGGETLEQMYIYVKKSAVKYPLPVLITNGNGTHWYMNEFKDEEYGLNDSDLAYMRANHISFSDYPKIKSREYLAKTQRLNSISSLLAFHVYAQKNSKKEEPFDLILWYEPSSELFALLPEYIGGEIRKEYEAIRKDEKAPSCKYFEVCKNVKGKIVSYTIYPNPASEELKVRVELEEERNVTISIADISGRIIKNIALQQTQGKGMTEYSAGIDELREGIYLVLIETDKGERVVQRIIKK